MSSLVLVVAATVALAVIAPRRAAAATPSGESIVLAGAYIVPVGCSLVTGIYDGAYWAYGEGAPQRWRTSAYICGAISIGVGTYVLVDSGDEGGDQIAVGVAPIVIGGAAILTALFVGPPDDIVGDMARTHVTPWLSHGGGGLVLSGSF
jgi:hypothetical protein